jgi:hypothetical protein
MRGREFVQCFVKHIVVCYAVLFISAEQCLFVCWFIHIYKQLNKEKKIKEIKIKKNISSGWQYLNVYKSWKFNQGNM